MFLREEALSEPESLRENLHEHEVDLGRVLDERPDRPRHACVYGRGVCAVDGLRERERVVLRNVDELDRVPRAVLVGRISTGCFVAM